MRYPTVGSQAHNSGFWAEQALARKAFKKFNQLCHAPDCEKTYQFAKKAISELSATQIQSFVTRLSRQGKEVLKNLNYKQVHLLEKFENKNCINEILQKVKRLKNA